jgi:proline iminopeptidase
LIKISETAVTLLILAMLGSLGCSTKKVSLNEGFVDVTGGKVWYRIYGNRGKTPILILHGGPGSSSYGLEPMAQLSKDRQVIFMDQLGSGRSTRITDTTLMTIEHYVEQVEKVRKALQLQKITLFGHSWGTALGLEYYLKYPDKVNAIIFNSPYFSTDLWIQDADTLVATLPDSVQAVIRYHEEARTYKSKEYLEAVEKYYSKFLYRNARSKDQVDSSVLFSNTTVYEYMWGPSEFTATGTLLNYDRVSCLSKIKVPALFLTGEYDEARPVTVKYFHSLVPGSEFFVIKNSGHVTLSDNPDDELDLIRKFLSRNAENIEK